MHFFVDESIRSKYLIAAIAVHPANLRGIRSSLRRLLLPGERSIHFKDESDKRRRELIGEVARMDYEVFLYTGSGSNEATRTRCLCVLMQDCLKMNAKRLVLEARGASLDRRDRETIAKTLRGEASPEHGAKVLEYTHLKAHEEPGLWLPDVIAWSYGAGGRWRQEVLKVLPTIVDVDKS